MERQEFKKQLDELGHIIVHGIACFLVWRIVANRDTDEAHVMNRYRGFFVPVESCLLNMALLQFAKVFDRDDRTVSLLNLLSAAKENRTLLVPNAQGDALGNLENTIRNDEQVLESLRNYRNQRLAHHDKIVSKDISLQNGQFTQLIDDVKDMYNKLSNGHDESIMLFDSSLSHDVEKHTSQVKRIICKERDRARTRRLS